jgi:hypothetical protein
VLFLIVVFVLSVFALFSIAGLSSNASLKAVHGSRREHLLGLGFLDRCVGVEKPRQIINTD